MAPNYHPDYARTLQENKNAFYRKTGENATHLDDGRTAVSRKSNKMLEKSRIGAGGGVSS